MDNETQILNEQLQAARLKAVELARKEDITPMSEDKERHPSQEGVPDDRKTRRAKGRDLAMLDRWVGNFLEIRAHHNDPDGQDVADRYDYYDKLWKNHCAKHNKNKRNAYTLRYDAFNERVQYFLGIEEQQIKAAKETWKLSLFKKHSKRYPTKYRWIRLWVNIWTFVTVHLNRRERMLYKFYLKHYYDGE